MAAGRPTDYNSKFTSIAKRFALLGLTNDEMADALDIARSTFYEWLKTYPEFSDAIKAGKDDADSKVVESLYHRAKGYKTTCTDVKVIEGQIVLTQLEKNYPPDTVACIYWLRNRRPDRWRNNPESETTETAEPLNITFNVADAKSDITITRGQRKDDES